MPSSIGRAWGPRAPTGTGAAAPARFTPAGKTKTGVKEASDVVSLPGGRFLVVSDKSDKVTILGTDGKHQKVDLPKLKWGDSQLEGVAYDPVRHHLFVVREESQELLRYEWNANKSAAPKLERKFVMDLDGPTNKGFEGLAYLPGAQSPTGKPQLLAVKEGKPRDLYVFDDGGGGKPLRVKLEKQVRDALKDFSAVTVDPRSGHLFLSSDESSTVAELSLVREGGKLAGRLVQAFPLRDGNKPLERVEGLSFNERGDLFVLTENDGVLHKLARQ